MDNPDIIAFTYASIFAIAMAVLAFFLSSRAWRDNQEILFALPIFPTMENCEVVTRYQESPYLPINPQTDPAILTLYIPTDVALNSAEMTRAIQTMVEECDYNYELLQIYENLEKGMTLVPNENDGGEPQRRNPEVLDPKYFTDSLEGLLKVLCPIVCLLGILVLIAIHFQAKNQLKQAKEKLGAPEETLKQAKEKLSLAKEKLELAKKKLDEAIAQLDGDETITTLGKTKIAKEEYKNAEEEYKVVEKEYKIAEANYKEYKALQDTYKQFNSVSIENILLIVILAGFSIFGVEVLWFFIERALSQPLIYGFGTSVLFISLVIGVFSFLYISWVIRLEITDLSIFASLLLLAGLITGMLLTNHVWDVGITNAYSTMSENAYPERLAYIVAGTRGSRTVFTSTFLTAGLLFGVYSLYLGKKVRLVKDMVKEEESKLMAPNVILFLGILAAILMTMVGFFPTDGIDYSLAGYEWKLDAATSGLWHKVGAFGSPLVILLMILSFWFMGYPKGQKKDRFLPISSYIWLAFTAIAMMMYVVGNFVNSLNTEWWQVIFDPNLQNPLAENRFNMVALPLYIILAVYFVNLYKTKKYFWFITEQRLPLLFTVITLAIGVFLGWNYSDRMTTVSLEFVILLVFSLFVYSYSKYLVEYEAAPPEDTDAKQAEKADDTNAQQAAEADKLLKEQIEDVAASPVKEALEEIPPMPTAPDSNNE